MTGDKAHSKSTECAAQMLYDRRQEKDFEWPFGVYQYKYAVRCRNTEPTSFCRFLHNFQCDFESINNLTIVAKRNRIVSFVL